jgi:polar amino acid transport system substrate-binding protein
MDLRGLFLATLVLLAPHSTKAEELSFCYDPYPPYTLGETGAPTGGLKVRLLEEVIKRIDGVTATVELLPWKRCQIEVQEGRVDGILPLFPNDERRSYMTFSDETMPEQSVFWYDRTRFPDGIDWSGSYDEIAGLQLGMLRGSYIDEDMEAAFSAGKDITRANGISALFLLLEHGRVDLVATDFAVGRYTAQQRGLSARFARIERPIATRTPRFGLSRATGADKYVAAFNTALQALRADGELDRILSAAPTD